MTGFFRSGSTASKNASDSDASTVKSTSGKVILINHVRSRGAKGGKILMVGNV